MPRKSNKQKAFGTRYSEGDTGNTRRMSKKRSDREEFLKESKTRKIIRRINKRMNKNTIIDPNED